MSLEKRSAFLQTTENSLNRINLLHLSSGPLLPSILHFYAVYSNKVIKEKSAIPLQMLNLIKTLKGKKNSVPTLDPMINFVTKLFNNLINARKGLIKI